MRELILVQSDPTEAEITPQETSQFALTPDLERLLRENQGLAFRVAQGVLRNAAEAEDVAQEALFRACRKYGKLREAQSFRGWLVRITFRIALDRLRYLRRREDRDTRWASPELRPPAQNIEEIVAGREFQARLGRALDELPERLRIVVLLAAMEGHTLAEIAALLDVPMGTVKSRLFKARKQLAEKLR